MTAVKQRSHSVFCVAVAAFAMLPVAPGADPPRVSRTAPIVMAYGGEADYTLVVGATYRGAWLDWKAAARRIRGGEAYRLYSVTGPVGTYKGSTPSLSEASGAAYTVKLTGPAATGTGPFIGVAGWWNPQPRKARCVLPGAAERRVVEGVLRAKRVSPIRVTISRCAKVDLAGDGAECTLIEACSPALRSPSSDATRPGDYSTLILVRNAGGRVQASILGGYFYGPRTPPGDIGTAFRLASVLDLAGSGRMQVIMATSYYEGGGAVVFDVRPSGPVRVLEAFDGA